MAGNSFGQIFNVLTFGESHSPYVGVVIDGLKPNLEINLDEIQKELDRRKPGQSEITTQRKESDKIQIISGIFEGKTTGTPICILIKNEDTKPSDYENIKNIFRPGHGGYTFLKKYGIYDYRGGGRISGRETVSRVVAGAIAKQLLNARGIKVLAYTKKIGNIEAAEFNESEIEKNVVRTPDSEAAKKMIELINQTKNEGDSIGGIVEVKVAGLGAGYGEPVFDKLEADLAKALMSIGSVRGFEIGVGFKCAEMKGSECNDEFRINPKTNEIETITNNSGGIQGGISNGAEIIFRIAVKPTSSISKTQKSVTIDGKEVEFNIKGRHDPCICPRIVPVAEAMTALVLIDHILMQEQIKSSVNTDEMKFKELELIDLQMLLLMKKRLDLIREVSDSIQEESNYSYVSINQLKDSWIQNSKELGLDDDLSENIFKLLSKIR